MMINEVQHAASNYKSSTGVGTDGCHPKLPLDLTEEECAVIIDITTTVEQCGFWPAQASTTMFFLLPENVTSDRTIAMWPTLFRWWEWLTAPLVQEWK